MIKVEHLRCEYLIDPLGTEEQHPRLSWTLSCDDPQRKNVRQTARRVVVRDDRGAVVWDSRRVRSDEMSHVRYAGAPLEQAARYHWQARIWDERGKPSAWSEPAEWTMGLWGPGWSIRRTSGGHEADVPALWISLPLPETWSEVAPPPCVLVRKDFKAAGRVRRAVLFASAMGLYQVRLNGRPVGDRALAPEWTDYHRKVQYQAYDVTDLLRSGSNAVGAVLAPGWYAGRIGMAEFCGGHARGIYGRRLQFIARLKIELAGGESTAVSTDRTWRGTTDGPIRAADLLEGESYDARMEMPGWDRPGFNDRRWAEAVEATGACLVAQPNEPIRITETLAPVRISTPKARVTIVDMGQNFAGWIRMKLRGRRGATVRFRYGEVLNPDGTLYTENLLSAKQTDRYVCRGGREEVFQPTFTYHGFRYVEITGLGYRPAREDISGCVVHSDAPRTGRFSCSNDLLNRIMSAVLWTQRSNMYGVPTDCPQRAERLGWMGDMQVFAQTAVYNMDMAAFFTKWVRDIRDAQADDGRFPDFAPHPFNPNLGFSGNPGWAEAGILVPWRMYVNYADRDILAEQFEAARRHVDWCVTCNPGLVWRDRARFAPMLYGDWLNADTFIGLPGQSRYRAEMPKEAYATAFFAHGADVVARMARALHRGKDAKTYGKLARNIRAAFVREFARKDGRIVGDTQAGYALALQFDLLPARLRPLAWGHLLRTLKRESGKLTTGIQTTIRLMNELSRRGRSDLAYDLALRTEMPSWGYMVENGGTTIWERWDGWVKGRGFQNPGMNSFNHYAIGAVGEWVWRTVAGINPDEASLGFRHFIIRPVPGGGLTSARGEYHAITGTVVSSWRIENGTFMLDLTVPCNTSATVYLPGRKSARKVGSGRYSFRVRMKRA